MAETRTVNLEIKDNVKSLKTQYKEAIQEVQRLADTYGNTSKEAANAAKRAAELKDRIEESKSLTDAFNPDAKFNALSGSIGGVLNGFQAYEGAMGLIGVESEELQKTLLKVQSAMALSQGIQGALEAKDAFVNLGAVVKNAFGTMTTASKAFLAGGIGLVITGIALAVNEFNKYNAELKESQKQQKLLADIEKEAIKNINAEASAADKLQKQLKDENLSRAEKTAKVKEFQKEYPSLLSNIDAEKSSINEINTALTQNIELLKLQSKAKAIQTKRAELYTQQLEIELGKEKAAKEARESAEESTFLGINFGAAYSGAASAAVTETEKNVAKQLKLIDEFDASIEKQIAALSKRGAVVKQEGDKENKTAEEIANYTRQLEKEKIDAMEDGMQKRIALLEFQRKEELSGIKSNGIKAGELKKAIEDRYGKEIEKVKFEYRDRSDRDEDVSLEKRPIKRLEIGKQEIDAEDFVQSEILRLQQEAGEKSVADAKAVAEQKAAIQQQGLDTALQGVQLIKGLFEKSKGVQKAAVIAESAIGIAKMIISNKLANAGALATPQAIATSGAAAAPVIALNNISTGIGIAANIAATAKALKSLGGGSAPSAPADGGGGGGGGGGASTTPQFNTIGSSGVNQLAQLQQQPVQAYVVSGDVTSAQSLDRNRIQNATL